MGATTISSVVSLVSPPLASKRQPVAGKYPSRLKSPRSTCAAYCTSAVSARGKGHLKDTFSCSQTPCSCPGVHHTRRQLRPGPLSSTSMLIPLQPFWRQGLQRPESDDRPQYLSRIHHPTGLYSTKLFPGSSLVFKCHLHCADAWGSWHTRYRQRAEEQLSDPARPTASTLSRHPCKLTTQAIAPPWSAMPGISIPRQLFSTMCRAWLSLSKMGPDMPWLLLLG